MKWLVCFDISDDKIRKKVTEILEEFGERVQKSVFEIEITNKKLEYTLLKIDKLIEKSDSVRCYPIYENQISKIVCIGEKKPPFSHFGIKFF